MTRRKISWRQELLTAAILGVVLFAARSSLADHYIVPTGSMEYTLLPGDRVIVDKTAYGVRVPFVGWRLTGGERPAAGEVVVFDSPDDGIRLIKRIVAVGGDEVEIRSGHLFRNGLPAASDEEASDGAAGGADAVEIIGERRAPINLSRGGGPDLAPLRVPDGHVLVVGDFRGNSRDGRMFGTIPETEIYGRGLRVFLRSGEGLTWRPL